MNIHGIAASQEKQFVDIAFGHSVSPFTTAYPWNLGVGFGTKYANPSTLPNGDCYHLRFSYSNKYLIIASGSSPYVVAYNWTPGSGYGTKFADPGTAVTGTVGRGANFSWDEQVAMVVATGTSPYINAYVWSSSGFGTKYSAPTSPPSNNAYMAEWNRDNAYVQIACQIANGGITGYAWTNASGFGTRLANPTSAGDTGFSISVSGTNLEIFLSTATTVSPFVHAYAWTGTAYGTKYANPASVGAGGSVDNASRTSIPDAVAFAMLGGTGQVAYPWTNGSGFGTKYTDPTDPLGTGSNLGRSVSWTPDGQDIVYGTGFSPYVAGYKWSSGYGTKYSAPVTTPTGIVRGGHFTN